MFKTTPSQRHQVDSLGHVFTGGGTGDNLDQFASNGGLTLSVVQNLEPGRSQNGNPGEYK